MEPGQAVSYEQEMATMRQLIAACEATAPGTGVPYVSGIYVGLQLARTWKPELVEQMRHLMERGMAGANGITPEDVEVRMRQVMTLAKP
jgi:hypothetical protein